jgi:hypothetical protein
VSIVSKTVLRRNETGINETKGKLCQITRKAPSSPPNGSVGVPHEDLLAGSLHADRQPLQLASTMTRRLFLISPTRIVELLETSMGKQGPDTTVMASRFE